MWLSRNAKTLQIWQIIVNTNKVITNCPSNRNYYGRCLMQHHSRTTLQTSINVRGNIQYEKLVKRFNGTLSPSIESGYIFSTWQAISNSSPVFYVQQSIIEIHDYTGLPWWASIIATTVLFRLVITLPLAIYQQRISARLEMLVLEIPDIVRNVKMETSISKRKFHWSEEQARYSFNKSLRHEWNKLIIRDNCHPAKTFIVLWAQIPLWILQSVALRNLIYLLPDPTDVKAQIVATELTVGGFGWIPNLTDLDHSFILPICLGLVNLTIIEIQSILRKKPTSRFHCIITNIFRGINIIIVPVACTVPSALNIYWVSSSCFGLLQNLLLISPKVKRLVGINKTPSEIDHPYKHLLLVIKQRMNIIKRIQNRTQ